jgi:DnaJ family protein C protein 17
MALDAKLRIQEARKQRYAGFDKKRKAMLEELEEAERADKQAKTATAAKKQKYAHEADQIRDAGKRMVEERQAELRRQQQQAERADQTAQEELEPPPLGAYLLSFPPPVDFCPHRKLTCHAPLPLSFSPSFPSPGEHDTTVRLKYPLSKYPHLTTSDALHTFMSSTFGPTDKDSIVLSIKPPKKAAHKPPKHATAAVPFKTIADAHAAVCASRRADRGLDEFDITWMGGSEPAVWSWAERTMLRSKKEEERGGASAAPSGGGAPRAVPSPAGDGVRGGLPQDSGRSGNGSQFSSFPSSFVRTTVILSFSRSPDRAYPSQSGVPPSPSSAPQLSAPGLDFESAVLMRMRQAERERIEREIREQEAGDGEA